MKDWKLKVILIRILILAAIIILWQFGAERLFPVAFFSKPSAIITEMAHYISTGRILSDLKATSIEIGAGYLIGTIVGLVMGVVLGRMPILSEILDLWHPENSFGASLHFSTRYRCVVQDRDSGHFGYFLDVL